MNTPSPVRQRIHLAPRPRADHWVVTALRRAAATLAVALALGIALAVECDFYNAFTQGEGLRIDGSALAQWLRSAGAGLSS